MIKLATVFVLLLGLSTITAADTVGACPLIRTIKTNDQQTAESKLQNCLLTNYMDRARPAKSDKDITKISVELLYLKIEEMLKDEDYLSMDMEIIFRWNDYRLTWAPENYANIKYTYLRLWKIWRPSIVYYDGRMDTGFITDYGLAHVNHTGHVTWGPSIRVHALCDGDYSKFPYDTQTCKFKFRRQMYQEDVVVYEIEKGGTTDLCESFDRPWFNPQCRIYTENEKIGYISAKTLTLEAKTMRVGHYYKEMILYPTFILSSLVLSLFWVPHHANQRFSLAGGLFFATLMVSLLLQNFLPMGISQIPGVVSYILYILVMLTITTTLSLVTQNIATIDPTNRSVPDLIKKIFLNDIVLMVTAVTNPLKQNQLSSFTNTRADSSKQATTSSDKLIDSICSHLQILNSPTSIDNLWKALSQVLDRLFFYIFFIVYIVVTSAL